MSGGLIIRLRPHEKVLVNGAILENGEKRAKFRVRSQDAHILRLRDALHPEDASTPVKRLYYTAQLAVTGDLDEDEAVKQLVNELQAVYDALIDDVCRSLIDQARNQVRSREFYPAMRTLKQLFPYEQKLLLYARAKELRLVGEEAE